MDSPDIQRKIALNLEPYDLISLCASQKSFYKNICDNQDFWRLKIERDFPEIFNYFQKTGLILRNPKNTYIRTFKSLSEILEKYSRYISSGNKESFTPILDNENDVIENKIYKVLYSSYQDHRKYGNNEIGFISNILEKYMKKYNLTEVKFSVLFSNLQSIIMQSPLEKMKIFPKRR